MKKSKRTNLKKAINYLIGREVPEQEHGNVGMLVEKWLIGLGYNILPGPVTDLADIEVKTRDKNATSAQTIGSMSITNIIATGYHDSSVKAKFQHQFRVKYSYSDFLNKTVIVSAEEYDFSDDSIQAEVKIAYEHGRAKLAAFKALGISTEDIPHYISGDGHCGYWERTVRTSTCWEFRMRSSTMERFELMAKASESSLFEF